jgi:hypothetical protein
MHNICNVQVSNLDKKKHWLVCPITYFLLGEEKKDMERDQMGRKYSRKLWYD